MEQNGGTTELLPWLSDPCQVIQEESFFRIEESSLYTWSASTYRASSYAACTLRKGARELLL